MSIVLCPLTITITTRRSCYTGLVACSSPSSILAYSYAYSICQLCKIHNSIIWTIYYASSSTSLITECILSRRTLSNTQISRKITKFSWNLRAHLYTKWCSSKHSSERCLWNICGTS